MRNFSVIGLILVTFLFSGCVSYEGMTPENRIARIQEYLIVLGYMTGKADGVMNSNTRTAITNFQKDRGIPTDGEVSRNLFMMSHEAAMHKRYSTAMGTQESHKIVQGPTDSNKIVQGQTDSNDAGVCSYANWDGVIRNLADLFACDEGRAIATLSEGRQIDFHVTSVAFHKGKLYAKSFIQDSRAIVAGQSLQNRDNFSWNDWQKKVQSAYFTFTCILSGKRAQDIRSGSKVRLNAKLVSYSGTSGSFECS